MQVLWPLYATVVRSNINSLTCAAMTRCLSAIKLHLLQEQSLHWQCLLCPLSQDMIPWFRHLAHLGLLGLEGSFSSKSSKFPGAEVFMLSLTLSHWLSRENGGNFEPGTGKTCDARAQWVDRRILQKCHFYKLTLLYETLISN